MTSSSNNTPVSRFATLGAALVVVTRHDDEAYVPSYGGDRSLKECRWRCCGCGASDSDLESEFFARQAANEHAGQCRSLPPVEDAAPSTAAELVSVTTAVRELTAVLAVIAKAVDPVVEAARALPDIATAIADLPDHGAGLADVATAVESLAASMERPRPSWVRRFVRRREVPAPEVADAAAVEPARPGDLILVRQRLHVQVEGQFPDSYSVGEVIEVDEHGRAMTWRSAGSFADTAVPNNAETIIVISQHAVDVAAAVRTATANLFPGTSGAVRPYRSVDELQAALGPHMRSLSASLDLGTFALKMRGDRS